jgi:cytochrome c biogenesis protein CcmG/thiol:disulfide interchange protein DsbE
MRMGNLKYLALIFWLTLDAAKTPASEIAGVGLVLGFDGQYIMVESILPDSPAAAEKQIQVCDRILAIAQDNEPPVQIQERNLPQALRLLRGATGTTVCLTIARPGEDQSPFRVVSFVRAELKALRGWGNGVLLTKGIDAPDIEMISLGNGKPERLSMYADRIVILEFWATWCGPCQDKMSELQSYSDRYKDWKDKVICITASVDDAPERASKHLKAKGWGQTHNVWVGADAIKAYHVDSLPTAYVIDRRGKILTANPRDMPLIVNTELWEREN